MCNLCWKCIFKLDKIDIFHSFKKTPLFPLVEKMTVNSSDEPDALEDYNYWTQSEVKTLLRS